MPCWEVVLMTCLSRPEGPAPSWLWLVIKTCSAAVAGQGDGAGPLDCMGKDQKTEENLRIPMSRRQREGSDLELQKKSYSSGGGKGGRSMVGWVGLPRGYQGSKDKTEI